MAELTTKEWIEHSRSDMLDQDPPAKATACLQDPDWAKLLRLWETKVEFSPENVDFLLAVDSFSKQPALASAKAICEKFACSGSPLEVNVSDLQRKSLVGWFWPNDANDIFAIADEEVRSSGSVDDGLDFIASVMDWRQGGRDTGVALEIFDDYIKGGAADPVTLRETTRAALKRPDAADFFAGAYDEVIAMLDFDPYKRFITFVKQMQPRARAALKQDEAISRPTIRAEALADGWIPDNAAVDAAQAKNRDNVKAIPGNSTGPISVGGALMLVGGGHDPEVVAYVERQSDHEEGILTVTKGGAFTKGALKVSGISGKKALVEKMFKEFSDKQVTFV